MTQRVFTLSDQQSFARISGDTNPVHVDPVAARRTLFGEPIVHGIHLLLWCLDEVLRAEPGRGAPSTMRVQFKQPVRLGQEAAVHVRDASETRSRVEVMAGETRAVRIRLDWGPASARVEEPFPSPESTDPEGGVPRDLAIEDIEGDRGELPLHCSEEAAANFPYVVERLGSGRLAALLASTRLVGMVCPGLHSIYSELEADLDASGTAPQLAWRTTSVDARFSLVKLEATAPGIAARITAFRRPAPRRQASFTSLRDLVPRDAFAGHRALVVGGSRGLGELTAKLLAAGGARVVITWARGAEDAQRVVDELKTGGADASAIHFDVLAGESPTLPDDFAPTHLSYLATPPILAGEGGAFDSARYDAYARVYVDAFDALVATLTRSPGALRSVFHPSSVYAVEPPPPFAEYGAAKRAAEERCAELAARHGFALAVPRLPRLATDQTASLDGSESDDPVPLLCEVLRDLG